MTAKRTFTKVQILTVGTRLVPSSAKVPSLNKFTPVKDACNLTNLIGS